MAELLLKLLVSGVLALLVKAGVAFCGHWIAWWMSAVIALVVVFGGLLIIDGSDVHQWWR